MDRGEDREGVRSGKRGVGNGEGRGAAQARGERRAWGLGGGKETLGEEGEAGGPQEDRPKAP